MAQFYLPTSYQAILLPDIDLQKVINPYVFRRDFNTVKHRPYIFTTKVRSLLLKQDFLLHYIRLKY